MNTLVDERFRIEKNFFEGLRERLIGDKISIKVEEDCENYGTIISTYEYDTGELISQVCLDPNGDDVAYYIYKIPDEKYLREPKPKKHIVLPQEDYLELMAEIIKAGGTQ